MDDIYLLKDGKREGPFTEDEVLQAVEWGFIPDYLLAWHWGLADWIPVGRLVDLFLELRSASPEQMEIALKSAATTSSQIVDLRAEVLNLTVACPHDQGNPRACPLHEVRKISWKEKCRWIDELSEVTMRNLLAFHQKCFGNKMKTKK